MLYSPGGTLLNTKSPRSLTVVLRSTLVSVSIRVTFADSTAAPLESSIAPLMELVMACPKLVACDRHRNRPAAIVLILVIGDPLKRFAGFVACRQEHSIYQNGKERGGRARSMACTIGEIPFGFKPGSDCFCGGPIRQKNPHPDSGSACLQRLDLARSCGTRFSGACQAELPGHFH